MNTHGGNFNHSSADTSKRVDMPLSIKIDGNLPDLRALKGIWGDLPKSEQSRFEARYGSIMDLLEVKVDFGLLRAFMDFYDPTVRGFVFRDVVLIPTIEEYSTLLGIPPTHENYLKPSNFKHMGLSRTLSNILGFPIQMVQKYPETRRSITGVDWFRLKDDYFTKEKRIGLSTGVISRFVALGIFALVLFPSARRMADENVVKAFWMFENKPWELEPVILSETFRALNNLKRKGQGRLKCCVELVYVWMMSHLPTMLDTRNIFSSGYFSGGKPIKEFAKTNWPMKGVNEWREFLNTLSAEHLILSPRWFRPSSYLYQCGSNQWLPLIGIRGLISYAPTLAARQFEDQQCVPDLSGLEQVEFDFEDTAESERKLANMEELWKKRQRKDRVRSRVACDSFYVEWHQFKFFVAHNKKRKLAGECIREVPTEVTPSEEMKATIARLAMIIEGLESENDKLREESASSSSTQAVVVHALRDEILQQDIEIEMLKKKVRDQEAEIRALDMRSQESLTRLTVMTEHYTHLRQQVNVLAHWGIKVIPKIQSIRTKAAWWIEHFSPFIRSSFYEFLMEVVTELEDFIIYKKYS